MDAIRRLSTQVRGKLGEQPSQIRQSEKKLESVTTPSLRALQLFSKADAVIATGRPGNQMAEALLREAIADDPEFASAHMHLAYAISNQGREDFLPYVERALKLSDKVSERERYFIRASYFDFTGKREEASANYRTLLQLYPDHYWANNNMADNLSYQGRPDEAVSYLIRLTELRPNDFNRNVQIAFAFANVNRWKESEACLRRASQLAEKLPENQEEKLLVGAWIDNFSMHHYWVQGDVTSVFRLLERWKERIESSLPNTDELLEIVWANYLYLGKFQEAEKMNRLGPLKSGDHGVCDRLNWLGLLLVTGRSSFGNIRHRQLPTSGTRRGWLGPA